jgi:2-dehydro-3-deoxyphosphogalactonate aldolase
MLETIQTAFHDAVVLRPLAWEDGYLLRPTTPGLGIELDLDTIAAHPYEDRGGRLHLDMTQTPVPSDNTALAGDLI